LAAVAVVWAQQPADALRLPLRQGRVRVSPAAAVPPVLAEQLAVVGPPWAGPEVAAVLAAPAPGEQLAAARLLVARPEPVPRLAGVQAARRVVHAVLSVHAARTFRVAPAAAQLQPARRLAAGRPEPPLRLAAERLSVERSELALRLAAGWLSVEQSEPALRLAAVPAARRIVRAVLSVHAARIFRVAPAAAQLQPAVRLLAG
jgi:hypothetical protein